MKKISLCIALLFLSGCAAHDHKTFCMIDYHQSLYNYHKESTNEQAQKHIEVLERIIQHANESNIKVAPGIYLEKGYFHQILGNEGQAVSDYQEEMARFPESSTFINKTLLSKTKATNNSKDNAGE